MSQTITVEQWAKQQDAYRTDATEEVTRHGKSIIAAGTEVAVYTIGAPQRGVVLAGPNYDFLHTSPAYEIEIDGTVRRCSHNIVVTAEDFAQSYHLWDDGAVVSGGPGMDPEYLEGIRDREYPGATIQRGW